MGADKNSLQKYQFGQNSQRKFKDAAKQIQIIFTPMKKILNYINGELSPSNTNTYLDNYDPSRGMVYSQIPDSDEKDVERAFKAANAAFPKWKIGRAHV